MPSAEVLGESSALTSLPFQSSLPSNGEGSVDKAGHPAEPFTHPTVTEYSAGYSLDLRDTRKGKAVVELPAGRHVYGGGGARLMIIEAHE